MHQPLYALPIYRISLSSEPLSHSPRAVKRCLRVLFIEKAHQAKALAVVRRMLKGETVDQAESGLSPREWRDLQALLELD